ncbi:MAG: hypothetical protein EA356_04975 [Geminicoccaceae bacterium]|nr:MAG: hypothetical protein EA356_04975 [Geminicoccaceae bacterium]
MTPSARTRSLALVVALALVAGAALAAAPASGQAQADPEQLARLTEIVRLWRASPSQDVHHLRALQALAARSPLAAEPSTETVASEAVASPIVTVDRAWPLAGPIVARFGEDQGLVTSEALRIAAQGHADVVAPAGGRVVFGDRLDGIGLVLIIDHGDEYHSVLAGMTALDVAAGTNVSAGQRVGRMTPGGYSADLHVELRRSGRPVDPLPWLGVDERGDG